MNPGLCYKAAKGFPCKPPPKPKPPNPPWDPYTP